jgi:hypothetical protein
MQPLRILVLVLAAGGCHDTEHQDVTTRPTTRSEAVRVLFRYLGWVNRGRFDSAASVFNIRPPIFGLLLQGGDTLSPAAFLREGCRAAVLACGGTPGRIIEIRQEPPDTNWVWITLGLLDGSGARYRHYGPSPRPAPDTIFTFLVIRRDSAYRVGLVPFYQ